VDRHVRANDEYPVGELLVSRMVEFVQNAPRGQHSHHGRFPGPRGHFASVSKEPGEPFGLAGFVGLVSGNRNALPQVGPRFGQKDDRLSSFALGEEEL